MSYYLHLIKSHGKVLNYHTTKLLIDSLVFSHLAYALSVWGPSVKQQSVQRLQQSVQRLQRFQNRAIRLLYHLQCFDHVTVHYRSAKWLPFSLVKYHTVCIMFYQYHHDYGQGIPLEPPIQFGKLSKYHTRTKENFAQPLRCHLSFAQSFFRNRGTQSVLGKLLCKSN